MVNILKENTCLSLVIITEKKKEINKETWQP